MMGTRANSARRGGLGLDEEDRGSAMRRNSDVGIHIYITDCFRSAPDRT